MALHNPSSAVTLICLPLVLGTGTTAQEAFSIRVVDDATGRGVPLVELRTVNDVPYYTDSAGIVAFKEPGMMDQIVFFHVSYDRAEQD